MNSRIGIQLIICLGTAALCLFFYLQQQNKLTQLRMYAPKVVKEIKSIQEENARLLYEVEKFESPDNMMRLSRLAEYSHLKHPLISQVLVMNEPEELSSVETIMIDSGYSRTKHTLAVGAK